MHSNPRIDTSGVIAAGGDQLWWWVVVTVTLLVLLVRSGTIGNTLTGDRSSHHEILQEPNESSLCVIARILNRRIDTMNIIDVFSQASSLTVLRAEWDDPVLLLSGTGWHLRVTTSWRLFSKGGWVAGCEDDSIGDAVRVLENANIVKVAVQSSMAFVDPVVYFSNDCVLEVFSASHTEPWVLKLPSGNVFVSSPSV